MRITLAIVSLYKGREVVNERVYMCFFLRSGNRDDSVFSPRVRGYWRCFYSLDQIAKYVNEALMYPARISNISERERKILRAKITSTFFILHPHLKQDIITCDESSK